MSAAAVSVPHPAAFPAALGYNHALGYLKAAIVALVVALHASLAYHPGAAPIPASLLAQPRVWQGFPVVDSHRALWAGIFATFNDIFFMALMFFLSGIFVWNSLRRKGVSTYMRDRLLRLGLPFFPVAILLAPLVYYPTYLQMAHHGNFTAFLHDWAALGSWSAGPVWFIWVLLIFDTLAVACFSLRPSWADQLGAFAGRASASPYRFFAWLVVLSLLAYLPLAVPYGPFDWAGWGPFWIQESRILLYLVYFSAGIGVGTRGFNRGLLAPDGDLARRWRVWVRWSVLAFLAEAVALQTATSGPIPRGTLATLHSWPMMAVLVLFPVSCAASSFAVTAIFLRFAARPRPLLDNLSRNSYGIFLVHYAIVSWLGYWLLGPALPAFVKFLLVTAGSIAISWAATIALRRLPGAQRVL